MCKLFFAAIVFALIIYTPVSGQGTATGTGYQMTMMNNPSLSGSDGTGSLRLSYLNFFPGNSYNLHSVYLSYDSYFQLLHGGAAFFLSDDYLGGIVNDMRAGVSYSYFLRAGDDLYINAGLSGSVIRRGYNFSGAILPDQIDPLGSISVPSSEVLSSQGKTLFDLGAGFSFISGKISGGISVVHLSEPSFSVTGLTEERLKRTVFVHLTGDLLLTRDKSLRIRPLFFSELRKDYYSGAAGASLETENLSFNAVITGDNSQNVNIQSGFSIGTGKLTIYYNYVFNVVSGNSLMPFSLLHQVGLAFSLKHVEKRNGFRAINFPK